MLATQDSSIIIVNENQIEDQLLGESIQVQISKIAVAPNGRFLACYRKDGVLTVMSSTFTTKVVDFDTKSATKPLDIAWCGEDSVLLLWQNTGIFMVGPYGDWLNFAYDDGVHLVAEPDCCRIFTSNTCEMLQRVPASTESIRRIGSTDPAALLYDAMEAFDDGDPKSDENIRSIASSNQLVDAVQSCINAASTEFDIPKQQSFMKAASYGKAFCNDFDPSEFVDVAKKLRVLNSVRNSEIGMPLTLHQYNRLTPEVLVNRLTLRHHHFLALKICELLKLKYDRILVHWACEKIKKLSVNANSILVSDESIRDTIRKKLEPYGRISYLEIAESAYKIGRKRLATMILDMEQQPADQVPLLLDMHEEELALQKAINSEDIDLIYSTLIRLERTKQDLETFHKLIHSHSEAANLLKIYYRNKVTYVDRVTLHNLLIYGKNFLEAGMACVFQAYIPIPQTSLYSNSSLNGSNILNKIQLLKEASSLFGQGSKMLTNNSNNSYGLLSNDLIFYKALTEDQVELMEIQRSLELKCDRKLIDLSLSDTIYQLTLFSLDEIPVASASASNSSSNTLSSDAFAAMTSAMSLTSSSTTNSKWEIEINKIVKKFKVSDKMLWHIKIQCYCKTNRWDLLWKLANERKSPVGYEIFATNCIK